MRKAFLLGLVSRDRRGNPAASTSSSEGQTHPAVLAPSGSTSERTFTGPNPVTSQRASQPDSSRSEAFVDEESAIASEMILHSSVPPSSTAVGTEHSVDHPEISDKQSSPLRRFLSILNSFLMPVSIAVIISIPCALIPPLRALFTPTVGSTGVRIPNAPDGNPPLSFILDSAAFIGAICIPAGLVLLGASFARLKVSVLSSNGRT